MAVYSFKRAIRTSTGLNTALMSALCVPVGLMLAPAAAMAQAEATTPSADAVASGDIVVTAERRSSSVQRTAASVSVRDGAVLQREGKFTFRQLLEDIPAVSAVEFRAQGASGTDNAGGNVTIRGISSNDPSGTVASVPSSAVYVDGIYEGVGSQYDIDRLEVLRGPQGTLYGRSATAGVLSFHTRDPQPGLLTGNANVEIGSYQLRHYTGALNVPVSDKIAIRVSGDQYQRDGFYNGVGGRVNRTSGRAKLLIEPSDSLKLLFGVAIQHNEVNTGGPIGTLSLVNGVTYNTQLPVTTSRHRFLQYWADIELDLGGVTINYLPAYRTWKQNAVQSVVGPALLGLRQTIKTPKDSFHTQELRFSGRIGEDLSWLGGVFYYDNRLSNTNDIRFASSGGLLANSATNRRTRNIGLYADATYTLSPTTRLTGGVRWDYTKVQTDQVYTTNTSFICNTPLAPTLPNGQPVIPGCPAGPGGANAGRPETLVTATIGGNVGLSTFRNFTFRARVEQDLSPQNLLYASVSSGFLPGDVQVGTGSNAMGQQVPIIRPYSSETLTAFEIGSKNRFFGNKLQLNGAVFYYRYGGFQTTVQPNPIDPSSQFVATVPARIWGAELEGVFRPGPDDQLSVNYAYVGSNYKNRPPQFVAAVSQDFVTGIAPHTVNFNYNHSFHFGDTTWLVGGYARFTSPFDRANLSPSFVAQLRAAGVNPDRVIRQSSQLTTNLTSTVTFGKDARFSITGYVRNLFDNRYVNYTVLQAVNPVFTASGGLADPRTVGVIASVQF